MPCSSACARPSTVRGPAVFPRGSGCRRAGRRGPRSGAGRRRTRSRSSCRPADRPGRPKRVALSADALLASAAASAAAIGGSGQWLLALPAHYIAGANVLVRSIAAGTDARAAARGPLRRRRPSPMPPPASPPSCASPRWCRRSWRASSTPPSTTTRVLDGRPPLHPHPARRTGDAPGTARARRRARPRRDAHLRLQRDQRRLRLRRRADRVDADRRARRPGRARRPDARARLPRRRGAHGRGLRRARRMPLVPHRRPRRARRRRRPGRERLRSACSAAPTTSSSRAA